MNLNKKKKIINKIKKIIKKTISIVISNPHFINSNIINDFRKEGRKLGIKIILIRNTLLKIAIKNTEFNFIKNNIFGNNLVCFSINNASFAARLCEKFEKKYKNFEIKFAIFEKKIIKKKDIYKLSNLPTLNEILYKLIYILKEISIIKLIRVLNNFKKVKNNNFKYKILGKHE
ncbi:MAG: 50S ribosomal protein L10 [Enterobacteriaceae bacterium PC38]|nr:MAG: 50S ribosomal protein L10 [Enterobacteriaceae bacterium PC38]